jgi:hypothetical protein
MSLASRQLDLFFIVNAAKAKGAIFSAFLERVISIPFALKTGNPEADIRSGVFIYRGRVDYLTEFLQLTPDLEAVKSFVAELMAHESSEQWYCAWDLIPHPIDWDECHEDWSRALKLATPDICWREESKKCLFWITDGKHNFHMSLLRSFSDIKFAAKQGMHLVGIGVKPGEERTAKTMQSNNSEVSTGSNGCSSVLVLDCPRFLYPERLPCDTWAPGGLEEFERVLMEAALC